MSHLLTDTIDAKTWAEEAIEQYKGGVYGQLFPGVIWTDARAADGSLLVEADPDLLLRTLARESMPLLNGHDPGRPIGHVLQAARFQGPQGQQFVAATSPHLSSASYQSCHLTWRLRLPVIPAKCLGPG